MCNKFGIENVLNLGKKEIDLTNTTVTIADVARYAGVSTATVGRVVGGYGTVSSKTKDRVQKAIKELGYAPNVVAQGLRSRKTRTIAVIIGSVSNSFFANMVSAIESEAAEYGYNVLICNSNEDPETERKHIKNLQNRMVDGIILSSAYPVGPENQIKDRELYTGRIPVVLVDRRVNGLDLDVIESDNFAAGYKTANYLLALGHRKIGILGTGNYSTINNRIAGYQKALADRKIEVLPKRILTIHKVNNSYNESVINNYLLENRDITAAMILNSSLAEAVLLSLNKLQMFKKEELSIICWDDSSMNKLLGLTTVLQFPETIGREAARRLIGLIENRTMPGERINLVNTELLVRNSCRPL